MLLGTVCYTLFIFSTYWLFSILASPQLNFCYYYYCCCVIPRTNYYLKAVLRKKKPFKYFQNFNGKRTHRYNDKLIRWFTVLRKKKTDFTHSAGTWRLWWWSLMSFKDRSSPAWIYCSVQRKIWRAKGLRMLIEYKTYKKVISTSHKIVIGSKWHVNALKWAL
jgi:hypothetical protein